MLRRSHLMPGVQSLGQLKPALSAVIPSSVKKGILMAFRPPKRGPKLLKQGFVAPVVPRRKKVVKRSKIGVFTALAASSGAAF